MNKLKGAKAGGEYLTKGGEILTVVAASETQVVMRHPSGYYSVHCAKWGDELELESEKRNTIESEAG